MDGETLSGGKVGFDLVDITDEQWQHLIGADSQITSSSTSAEVLAAGERLRAVKRANPLSRSRDMFTEGAKFRVISDIARLEGIVLFGETSWSGWSRNLAQGEVVTFAGWKPGWQTPQALIATFHAERTPQNIILLSVWPLAGLFLPYPLPGILEMLEE